MKTGKYDKNDKQIEEGDIITFNTTSEHLEGKVYYDSQSAAFRINTDSGNYFLGGAGISDIEIIKKKLRTNPSV